MNIYTPNSYEVNRLDRLPDLRRERERKKNDLHGTNAFCNETKKPKGYSI